MGQLCLRFAIWGGLVRRIKWYALIQAFRALEALGLERSAEWLARVYSAEVIARACEVKLSTARAYKSGRLKPGPSAVRLWQLHRERMVLTSEWAGWVVKAQCLVTPEGVELPRNILRMHQVMLQYYHDLARRTGDEREIERFYELLKAA
jgi:Phage protein